MSDKDNESDLKRKRVFNQSFDEDGSGFDNKEQAAFTQKQTFSQPQFEVVELESDLPEESRLEEILRPNKKGRWWPFPLTLGLIGMSTWQAVDKLMVSYLEQDWLSLGWAGLATLAAGIGIGAIVKELNALRRLKNHFSTQEEAEVIFSENTLGSAKAFCEKIAVKQGGVTSTSEYQRWKSTINNTHDDAEILEMYDAMVLAEQDKAAAKVITKYSTESAALVAVSPLAVADITLLAWRNFSMLNRLSEIYGVELGYWSRLKLFKATLINMAAAGASELAMDASMDLLSVDLAGRVSARAAQGIGVGVLTARLGIRAASLLRPIPWQRDKAMKLSAVRAQILEKVVKLAVKK
ncbi:YcjF family protein [Vibrio sp.]|nr:YcjF family protein [Vibrio sp.]